MDVNQIRELQHLPASLDGPQLAEVERLVNDHNYINTNSPARIVRDIDTHEYDVEYVFPTIEAEILDPADFYPPPVPPVGTPVVITNIQVPGKDVSVNADQSTASPELVDEIRSTFVNTPPSTVDQIQEHVEGKVDGQASE